MEHWRNNPKLLVQASILCSNPVRSLDNVGYYGRYYGAEETREEVDGKTS